MASFYWIGGCSASCLLAYTLRSMNLLGYMYKQYHRIPGQGRLHSCRRPYAGSCEHHAHLRKTQNTPPLPFRVWYGTQVTRGQAPRASAPGSGERRWLSLELRLVADVGLVSRSAVGRTRGSSCSCLYSCLSCVCFMFCCVLFLKKKV